MDRKPPRAMNEAPLAGGRTTPGIVRVGDTVRRPPATNAPFVRALLAHLEMVRFNGAPRALGVDEDGREILSYVEGQVPTELGWHGDAVLRAAAKLIRRFHDATVSLLDTPAAKSAGLEIVCHNDLSPCNIVFRDALPVAIIDFDAAAPGSRRNDIGYAAWLWLDLGNPDIDAPEQRRRLRLFLAGYGGDLSEPAVVEAIMARQRVLIAEARRTGKESTARWAADCLRWSAAHLRSCRS